MRRGRDKSVGHGRGHFGITAFAVVVIVLAGPALARAETLPSGFDDREIAQAPQATAFAFVPDGRILITSQLGQLYVFDGSTTYLALDLDALGRICNNVERGILGVAVDPAFVDQNYIYLSYTYRKNGTCGTDQFDTSTQPVNRVSRFLLGANNQVDPATEQVLLDNISTPAGYHNAGDVQFGKDGYLYVSVGDGGCNGGCGNANPTARDRSVLNGKILRIASDGSVPQSNPFTGAGTARCNLTGKTTSGVLCQETYSWGLRNPFRIAFDSNAAGTRFFIMDVGQETWEEIDLGQSGADYGWNVREGPCATGSTTSCGAPPAGMTNPVYWYDHTAGCSSVNGGAFVPSGVWPSSYDGHYLYTDIVCQKIVDLAPNGSGGFVATDFATGAPQPLGMQFAPYGASGQALYYISYWPGSLHRIALTGSANRSPNASALADTTYGDAPLEVDFDASGSSDPDGDPLSFDWDFGDGSTHATTPQASHLYTQSGAFTAKVTVSDGNGGSDSATMTIYAGDNAPVPSIQSPTGGQLFDVDQTITLTGSAYDPEDQNLPNSALTWEVVRHHGTHTHPFLPPTTGNNIAITGPTPEDLPSAGNSYLEVRLTATDSEGLSRTITRDLRPHTVNLSLSTVPAGLRLVVNGQTAPVSLNSWAGWKLQLYAPDQTDADGQGEVFVSWSDGGTQTHEITTPSSAATYSATFTKRYVRPRGASPVRVSLVPAYSACTSPDVTHGPPLASGSCSPPKQASGYATVGTPDANGLPARSHGWVRLATIAGNPGTTEDEADVKLAASISDVLDRTDTLDYYVGQLQASVDVRLTDLRNGNSGTDAATVTDFPLRFELPCVVDLTVGGSTCATNTTADALAPGTVVEGDREIWALGPVQVYDGGPDGLAATSDNTLFATQGLFVP